MAINTSLPFSGRIARDRFWGTMHAFKINRRSLFVRGNPHNETSLSRVTRKKSTQKAKAIKYTPWPLIRRRRRSSESEGSKWNDGETSRRRMNVRFRWQFSSGKNNCARETIRPAYMTARATPSFFTVAKIKQALTQRISIIYARSNDSFFSARLINENGSEIVGASKGGNLNNFSVANFELARRNLLTRSRDYPSLGLMMIYYSLSRRCTYFYRDEVREHCATPVTTAPLSSSRIVFRRFLRRNISPAIQLLLNCDAPLRKFSFFCQLFVVHGEYVWLVASCIPRCKFILVVKTHAL